jgi:hypothetical protein
MPNNYPQPTVYLASGSPEDENRLPDGYSGGQLGSRFTVIDKADSNKAKGYQLVKADSVMDVEPSEGAVAYWLEASGYLVTTDVSAAGRGNVAGVFRNAVTLGNICCIQQQGSSTVQVQTGTPSAAGLEVIPSATDAKADVMTAGTAATYPIMGLSRSTASGSPSVFTADLTLGGRP